MADLDPDPVPTRPAGPIEAPLFTFGDRVSKVGGDYRFDGEIRGVVTKLSGALRYVVEDDRGVLHVFSAKQLTRREAPPTASDEPVRCDECGARLWTPSAPYPPLAARPEPKEWR